ncbi:MAG: peptidoglycan DD-metalloendopeptidase family protein [Chloroflexota bacterium]
MLAGCGGALALPTAVPLAVAPETATAQAAAEETEVVVSDEGMGEETAVFPSHDDTIPTPAGDGLRPEQIVQNYVRAAAPAARSTEEWRPPPMAAPLSYNPDDHYWLIRPIPSGKRNYDLEWYPFGNDVQAADIPPYRIHHGIDFPNETGTPVLAAGSGTVIHAGPFPSPTNGVNYYGNTVIIQHDWQWQGKDVFTLYAHTLELFVAEGDTVDQGQVIAGVGSSGEVTGPHLHLEVRVGENTYANARNPALWLVPYEGWGTLAGRIVDNRGRPITGAKLQLRPPGSNEILRQQSTYATTVRADDIWQENFVIGDVPAGKYELHITVADVAYKRNVEIFSGQTTYETIATEFSFIPTSTPIPLPTPVPTLALPGAVQPGDPLLIATPTPES